MKTQHRFFGCIFTSFFFLCSVLFVLPEEVRSQEDPGNLKSRAGAPVALQEVARRLQKTYEATSTLSAHFSQVTSSQLSGRKKEGRGSLLLLKPGLMRWDYQEPDRQVIVCDGKTISMYFENEKQMLVASAKEYLESDVTYSFFAGTGNILKDFDIENPEDTMTEAEIDETVLRLKPKKQHPQIDYILVWTNKKFVLKKMMIVDTFGSVTNIEFTDLEMNTPISKEAFSFVPPEGTEIISQ